MDKALMARATSSDDAPTPGYMYGEISKMSLVSYEACKEIQDYLLARLKKSNHNVKYKALIIIKHVCRAGRPDFKRDMTRQTEASGPSYPSAAHGTQLSVIFRCVPAAAHPRLSAVSGPSRPAPW